LPCIVCGCQLDDALQGIEDNQPYAGTSFVTGGHYGSTAFDPMDGSRLEINVCDPCLTRAADRRIVIHHSNMGRVSRWAGDRECA
jgi:hypothetical protein